MPDIVTDIELPPLSLENLQHINWLTTIMLHTNTTTLRNKLISSFRTLMSFNLSHSLRHTCTLSPVTGGGGIESDSRWDSQTSLSWEHGCQQLICPILHPLRDCRLAHFAHNKSASSSSVSLCASMNYLTLLSPSLSSLHLSTFPSVSVTLIQSVVLVKLTEPQHDMKKTTPKTILTSHCCPSFLETKYS